MQRGCWLRTERGCRDVGDADENLMGAPFRSYRWMAHLLVGQPSIGFSAGWAACQCDTPNGRPRDRGPYSARNASTGLSRAARIAGTTPAASPISTDTPSAPKA